MHFSTIVATILAGAALNMAIPLTERQAYVPCTGTESNAQCCATDVLGVADLNCASPPSTPANLTDFENICAAIGQQARCCALPILNQALICTNPV